MCQRGSWVIKIQGLSKTKKFLKNPHRHRQLCGDTRRKGGFKVWKRVKRRTNGDGRKLDLGGTHNTTYR